MSATSPPERSQPDVLERLIARLPQRLRPLEQSQRGRTSRRRWRVEVAILLLVGVVIGTAATYDVTRQVSINFRLTADIATWRHLTHNDWKNISVETDTKHFTKHDMVCGNVSYGRRSTIKKEEGKPGSRTQICFMMVGQIVDGRRATHAGFFVAPDLGDVPRNRWGCFGAAARQHLCDSRRPSQTAKPTIPFRYWSAQRE